MRRNGDERNEEEPAPRGLLYGVTTWHVRVLCDNPWDGGRGYTPKEVGELSVDQVLMLLTDRKLLLARRGKHVTAEQAVVLAGEDGAFRGRSVDGTEITLRSTGKSKAQQLRERAAKAIEKTKRGKRRG